MSNYPIGATWIARTNHKIGYVWLDERTTIEVWRWKYTWDDGSGGEASWTTSRRMAVEQCSVQTSGPEPIRFKRIADPRTPTNRHKPAQTLRSTETPVITDRVTTERKSRKWISLNQSKTARND